MVLVLCGIGVIMIVVFWISCYCDFEVFFIFIITGGGFWFFIVRKERVYIIVIDLYFCIFVYVCYFNLSLGYVIIE